MTKYSWFRNYCKKTTSHCMEYFVMKQRSLIEKTFWIFTFLLVLFLSTTNIISIINVWINNPTLIVIENSESSISDIPLPAIIICPSNQIRKSVWEKHMNTNTSYWQNLREYRSLVCSGNFYASTMKFHSLDYFDYEILKNLVKDYPISCPELFQSREVKWQNSSTQHFCNVVQPLFTRIGQCYVINMIPAKQMFNDRYYKRYSNFHSQNITMNQTKTPIWSLDDGYTIHYNNDDTPFDVFPARTSGVSYYHRLKLRMHILNKDFYSCPNRNFLEGYFIILYDNPAGLFTINSRTFVMPDTYMKIQITPFVKKISSDLKSLSPKVRNCYFQNEKKLLFFKNYSESNCHHECIINETLSKCECMRMDWTFLVEKGDKICGTSKYSCALQAIYDVKYDKRQGECNCLPTCTVVNYQISDTTRYDDWEYLKTTNLTKNDSNGATVEFIFKNPYFNAYQVKSTFNIYSLISVVGGMLGLFLGLNIINVFEILFVITEIIIHHIVHIFNK